MNSVTKNLSLQSFGDKTAISLSFLCVLHCLLLPLLIILIPSVSSLWVSDENFHKWMLVGVVFSSLFALFLGYCKHHRTSILAWGAAGLTLLIVAFLFGHDFLGEAGEKFLTVLGAIVVAIGHIKNYRTCRIHSCEC